MAAAAAAVATVSSPSPASRRLLPSSSSAVPSLLRLPRPGRRLRRALRVVSAGGEADVLPGPGGEAEAAVPGRLEEPRDEPLGGSQLDICGLAFQGDVGGGFAGGGGGAGSGASGGGGSNKTLDRGINTAIVLGASTFALTKLLTVDQDYWHVRLFILTPFF